MIDITYKQISSIALFTVWGILGVIGIREFIKLIKIVGFGSIFQYTSLKQIKNPEHYKAVVRWKKVVFRLFLIWIVAVIILFSLGMWLNKPEPAILPNR